MPGFNRTRTLALSSTAIAFALAGAAMAQPVEEVVVTGTHIRGVAPVGSTVISVGSDDLQKTGANNTSDLLLKVPQVVNMGYNEVATAGGTRTQQSAGNITFSRSINLRGIGRERTLTLFNGQRMVPNGGATATDLDMFPTALVSRVEVVADGGSAIYGSDAIAGTVNIVLREPEDVVETTVQTGIKASRDSMDWLASQTIGKTWDASQSGIGDGGIILNYTHSYFDSVDMEDMDDLYNDDFSPFGGPAYPLFANPGNVRGLTGPGITATTTFAVPAGIGPTQALTLARLGAAGTANRQSAWLVPGPENAHLPKMTRDVVAGVFKQELTDWLTFNVEGSFSRRHGIGTYGSGPGLTSTLTVPKTNPYSPCNPANYTGPSAGRDCPGGAAAVFNPLTTGAGASNISVLYNWAQEAGVTGTRFKQQAYVLTGEFDVELPYDWTASISGSTSSDYAHTTRSPQAPIASILTQVLSGTGKPANVPFFNPFCDSNAASCNSQITLDYILTNITQTETSGLVDFQIDANGPIFDLPGGTVRLAAGGTYTKDRLIVNNFTRQVVPGVDTQSAFSSGRRWVKSVFAELYVPLVGESNAMPGVKKLEMTLAGRITDYQVVGTTRDPKIGINWTPVDEFKIHASWGTSFRAPNLREIDPFARAGAFTVDNITCGLYPGINLAACPAGAATPLSTHRRSGGNANNVPETARTWSVGVDWTPEFVPGLTASLNYFNLSLKGAMSQAAGDAGENAVVNSGLYDRYVIFNPTYFPARAVVSQYAQQLNPALTLGAALTQAQYNALFATFTSLPYSQFVAAQNPVAFFYDGSLHNNGTIKTDGLDFTASYDFDFADGWSAHLGAFINYVMTYDNTVVQGSPVQDLLNKFSGPLRFRGRLEAGVDNGPWNVTAYLNYANSYDSDPGFVFAGAAPQYLSIDSLTTADLSVTYDIGGESAVTLLRNLQLSATVTNVFDTEPPLFLNFSTFPIRFDPANASPFGRVVTLRMTKKW